jgi:phospholipase/carboxylesterase
MSDETTADGPREDPYPADTERVGQLLGRLLPCLDTLQHMARYVHPSTLPELVGSNTAPFETLRPLIAEPHSWPEHLAPLGRQLEQSAEHACEAERELAEAASSPDAVQLSYKALRHLPKALEALYPLAGLLPPVNRFFLEPGFQDDGELMLSLSGPAPDGTGVMAFGADPDSRETFWAFVPENYDPEIARPLIVALHGGAGKGRSFLWSWLSTARSRGAVLIAPTSLGPTWALQGDDVDSPHLARIVEFARETWNIDPARLLLTGMSDGGTYSYVSGLLADSPFTHLAPFSAAFHPMLGSFADGDRVRDLPVHIVHGALDWMFPAEMAQGAHEWFVAAKANVTYREIADLSHTYAAELNRDVIDWVNETATG